jgi:ribonuclease HII
MYNGMSLFEFDSAYNRIVIGIDEAGRGPLAGDVYAAAVILNPNKPIEGLNDSKKLTEAKRERLYDEIIANCIAFAIATASVDEIEELNILHAALLAMKRAYCRLTIPEPYAVLIDGNKLPPITVNSQLSTVECIVKGDGKSAAIAAASILAKVARDRYALELDRLYPQYQFAKHKGYATKLHREMILAHGASPVHRKLFLRKII